MNRQKQYYFLLIIALLASALIWGSGVLAADPAASPGDDLPPDETPPATETFTPTATITPTPSPTIEQTAEPTATEAVTETATPEATATPEPTPTPIVNYLPVLSDIPPPMPEGCEPLPHIPGNRPATERDMAAVINGYRLNNGLHALNVMPHLTQAARRHALDMAANEISEHAGSDGSNPGERTSDACYDWANVGEIIGVNGDVTSMFNAWVGSKGNNALILAPEFLDYGVGYVYDPDTKHEHYWVVVFGRSLSSGLYEQNHLILPAN